MKSASTDNALPLTAEQEAGTAVDEFLEMRARILGRLSLEALRSVAKRLNVPKTWIQEMTRSRATDVIPHLKFGKYVRFQWGCPALNQWISRRSKGGKQQ